jgi:hypothetical protein
MEPLPDGSGEKYLVPLNMLDAASDPPLEPTPVRHTEPEFLLPVIRQQVEKYSDRVSKSKKHLRTHEKVIVDGLLPVATAYLKASGKRYDAGSTTAAVVRFVDYWDSNPDDVTGTRVSAFVEILKTVEDAENEHS